MGRVEAPEERDPDQRSDGGGIGVILGINDIGKVLERVEGDHRHLGARRPLDDHLAFLDTGSADPKKLRRAALPCRQHLGIRGWAKPGYEGYES